MRTPIRVRGILSSSISDVSPSIDVTLEEGETIIEPLSRILATIATAVETSEEVVARFEAPYPIEVTVYWEGKKKALDVAMDINNEINNPARTYIALAISAGEELGDLLSMRSLARQGLTGELDWKRAFKSQFKTANRKFKRYTKRWLKWLLVTEDADPNWVGEDSCVVLD